MLNINFKKYLIITVPYVFLFSTTLNAEILKKIIIKGNDCLLYTSPSPRD